MYVGFLITFIGFRFTCLLEWRKRFSRWVAINVFSGIVKVKTTVKIDNSQEDGLRPYEEERLLLKDIDLTNRREMLNKICLSLLRLFMTISCYCAMMFCSFLLLDVSHSCDYDNTKDCFEYKSGAAEDPIDCNSAAVQNGTVQVVCYKIPLNFGLAACASYGTFKFVTVTLNAATSVILLSRKRKNVCRTRIILGMMFVVIPVVIISLVTYFRAFIVGDKGLMITQTIAVLVSAMIFLSGIPGKDLVDPRRTTSLRNLLQDREGYIPI